MVTLKILTANMWLLPPPTSINNQERLDNFINLVKKLDPDAINLQEVWLNKYINYLKKKLLSYRVINTSSLFYNKSGLVTLIKHKPIKVEFHKFDIKNDLDPVERIASKGFLRTQFSKGGNLINLINTHVYQSFDESKLKIKLSQIEEVIKKSKAANPTIIAGDLNVFPEKISKLVDQLQKELEVPVTYSENNAYAHKAVNIILNRDGVYNERPNRILANIKKPISPIKLEVIKNPLVSDHFPLLAEITLPRGKYIKTSLSKGKKILMTPKSIAKKILKKS